MGEATTLRRARSRRLRMTGSLLGIVALSLSLVPLVAGSTMVDLTAVGSTATIDDVLFQQGPIAGSAGTGVLDPFLRVQRGGNDPDIEQGYNTDYRPLQYDEDAPWTESLLLSTVPVTTTGGVAYRKFNLDINQTTNNPFLSLDGLQLFVANSPTLHGFDPTAGTFSGDATRIFTLGDKWIKMDYRNAPGSGVSDLSMLVPESKFVGSGLDCGYGQPGCETWVYLYNQFGTNFPNNDGFEEWSTEVLPFITLTKTATGTFDRTFTWDLDKSGLPLTHNLFAGGSADTDYDIDVDQTITDGNIQVTGTITITVPAKLPDGEKNSPDATITSLTDVLAQGATLTNAVISGCEVPFTVKGGATKTCTYTIAPSAAIAGTNTVTAVITGNETPFTYSTGVTFSQTTVGYPTVNVTDTFDGGTPEALGSASGDTTFDNDQTFTCSTDPDDYTNGFYTYDKINRAEITETGANDSVTVTVNCYAPVVSKTADGTFNKNYTWDLDKSGLPLTHNLFAGGSADTDYDIDVDQTIGYSDFLVSGSITVANPNPNASMTVNLTDALSTGGAVTIICPAAADPAALVIPAKSGGVNGSVTCTYSGVPTGAANEQSGSNTATAAIGGGSFTGSDTWAFDSPTIVGYPTVNVTDTFDGGTPEALGSASGDTTFDNDQTFTCSTDPDDYTNGFYTYDKINRAEITETGANDSVTVTVNCYAPVVSKTADGTFDRDWDWSIGKTGDQTALELAVGQSFLVNYSVTVTATKTDSGYEVTGTISVHNPHPSASMDVDVADQIGTTAAVIDCGSGADDTTLTVAHGATGTCDYVVDFGPTQPAATTNTATVTFNSIDFTATDGFGWAVDQETDECITVTDSPYGALGTVCAGDSPRTFTYSMFVGPYEACGTYEYRNTASFVTNDTAATGSSSWTVDINIPCGGCTLTQGYWKTHSLFGPAPSDDAWALLDALQGTGTPVTWAGDGTYLGASELFFSPNTSATWYDVFWIAPAGNVYYQLAHQYQAAVLNILNDASAPTSVTDAIAHAEALFEQYLPAEIGALKGNKPVRKDFITTAGILASYNEGKIGPGHCDEDRLSSKTE